MIFVKNKYYPAKGFIAITHWPFVFYKKDSLVMRRHEAVHGAQQKELFFVLFYIIYLLEWAFKGYKNISFEKEAYANQDKPDYLLYRKPFKQFRKP